MCRVCLGCPSWQMVPIRPDVTAPASLRSPGIQSSPPSTAARRRSSSTSASGARASSSSARTASGPTSSPTAPTSPGRRATTAGVEVENEWERELMEQMRPSNDLWRSMAPPEHGPLSRSAYPSLRMTRVRPTSDPGAIPGRSRHLCRLPDLDPDDRPLRAPLASAACAVEPVVWDDPASTGPPYDLVVLRSHLGLRAPPRRVPGLGAPGPAAGQPGRRGRRGTPTSATWRELAAAGVPVMPTTWVAPGERWTPPAGGRVGGQARGQRGSQDTGRYDAGRPERRTWPARTWRRLHDGRPARDGPALPGRRRHRRRDRAAVPPDADRRARLQPRDPQGPDAHRPGPRRRDRACYEEEQISPREPSPAELAVRGRRWRPCPAARSGCSTPGST